MKRGAIVGITLEGLQSLLTRAYNLPPESTIVAVLWDDARDILRVKLHGPTLPSVHDGDVYPVIDLDPRSETWPERTSGTSPPT